MDKIICEICGTVYPESSEKCPICGCSQDFGLGNMEDEFLTGTAGTADSEESAPKKKNKEIFDFDEVNQEKKSRTPQEEDDFDDEEAYEEEPRTNTVLVVILVILIVLLLLTAGFFFIRYFLPNMGGDAKQTEPSVTTVPAETVAGETTEPTIPCTNLVIPGGKVELGEGGLWLMNVQVYPEDTTDVLTYVSADENVVTVNESGTVTAVGEGQTTVTAICGSKRISCNITVDYSIGAETVPEETIPVMTMEGDSGAEATEASEAAGETQATEETQPEQTTEAAEGTTSGEVVLKLKKTDISIFARYTSVTLELDCDVKPEDIYWFTMDSTVAIVNNGVVTATGSGITRIYGEYEGQRVECIIRCSF